MTGGFQSEQSCRSPLGERYRKVLLITINHSYAGFFAYMTFAINQLIYAEKHGYLPVVWFGPDSGGGPNAFYDPTHGENVWDYYFEPVAGYTYNDIQSLIASTENPLSEDDVIQLPTKELWRLHHDEPDSIFNYPYGCYRHKSKLDPDWYRAQRVKAHEYISRYIRVRPEILDEVGRIQQHFDHGRALGVHLRGTDKGTAGAAPHLMRVIKPATYFPIIDDYMDRHSWCTLFVATDQAQFVDLFRSRYGDRVLATDAMRSETSTNPFQQVGKFGYQKGREVLIDALLLSRCEYLIKCTSAVGEYAMYFNPDLDCIDTNHLKEHTSVADVFSLVRTRARHALRKYLVL